MKQMRTAQPLLVAAPIAALFAVLAEALVDSGLPSHHHRSAMSKRHGDPHETDAAPIFEPCVAVGSGHARNFRRKMRVPYFRVRVAAQLVCACRLGIRRAIPAAR